MENYKILRIVEEILDIDPSILERKGQDINFSEIIGNIEQIYSSLNLLRDSPSCLDMFTDEQKNRLENFLKEFYNQINKIRNFNPIHGMSHLEQRSINSSISSIYTQTRFEFLATIDTYHIKQILEDASGLDKIIKEAQETAKEAQETAKEAQETAKEAQEKIIKSQIRERRELRLATSRRFERHFGILSETYKKRAKKWLIALIALVLILIALTILVLINVISLVSENNSEIEQVLGVLISRIVFLSPLIWGALYLCIKNYNANIHLEVTNTHRHVSQRTFEFLIRSFDDPAIVGIITSQVTATMFELGDTGYTSSKLSKK